jgi:RNA polymerase sigma-70 factor (ECF subfamily)
MSEQEIDTTLINEVLHGNTHAFDTLVLKYQYKVFKLVSRYIKDPSEVLDVTQDTFMKAYKSLAKFRGDSSFYTWLYRIAINTAKNYIISKDRKVPDLDIDINEIEQGSHKITHKDLHTPELLSLNEEMYTLIREVMETIPSELKTAILLREVEGMTYQEIAQIMDCPVGTVRSRIHRAKEIIEKKVQAHVGMDPDFIKPALTLPSHTRPPGIHNKP